MPCGLRVHGSMHLVHTPNKFIKPDPLDGDPRATIAPVREGGTGRRRTVAAGGELAGSSPDGDSGHHSRCGLDQNEAAAERNLTTELRDDEIGRKEVCDGDVAARSVGGDGSLVRRSKLNENSSYARGVC